MRYTTESFLFNKTAAAALLGGICTRLEVWANCVWVICRVGTKTIVRFVSKRSFLGYFAKSRKERSEAIAVWSRGNHRYLARSTDKLYGNHYTLTASLSGVSCSCEDYKAQQELLNGPRLCKHGYAVLHTLGFESLRDYLNQ